MNVMDNTLNKLFVNENKKKIKLNQLLEAPQEWNFYRKLPAKKMQELIDSILTVGLLNPIIVWEQDNGNYMILSGHNRVRAYSILNKNSKDGKEYSAIEAIIKQKDEINEEIAKQIIIDTNWVQRDLSTSEKVKSIMTKYTQLKKISKLNKNYFDINSLIAKEYNLTKRQIINYKTLNKLIPKIQQSIDDGNVNLVTGLKLAKLPVEIQNHIYNKYILTNKYNIVNSKYKSLTTEMSVEDIDKLFEEKKSTMGKFCIQYPDKETGIYKKAYVSYPIEDEKYFYGLIDIFCGGRHDLIIMEDDTYKEGDFIFTKIK